MIKLAQPVMLWTLAGLAVPVAIHLLSRKTGGVVLFGSLRHLTNSKTQQFKSLRLNEVLLLALRILILACFAILLAELKFEIGRSGEKKWLVIESGIEKDGKLKPFIDSLERSGYEAHRLMPGFPPMDAKPDTVTSLDYRLLSSQLSAIDLKEAVVLSHFYEESFRGKQVALPGSQKWIECDGEAVKFAAYEFQSRRDTVITRAGHSNEGITSYDYVTKTGNVDSSANALSLPIVIHIISDSSLDRDAILVSKSIHALQKYLKVDLKIILAHTGEAIEKQCDVLIWLSRERVTNQKYKRLIRSYTSLSGSPLLTQFDDSVWELSRVDAEAALEDHLTLALATPIFDGEFPTETIQMNDRRVIATSQGWGNNDSITAGGNVAGADTSLGMFSLLVCLLVAERLIAYRKNL